MPRDQETLIDIVQAAQRVIRFTQGVSRTELESNEDRSYALTKRALYGVNLNTVLQDCPG